VEGPHYVTGYERRPVVEPNAAPQVKGVYFSVRRDLPALGQCGLESRIRGESRQPIENIGDRATAWHIGREGRIERLRIVTVARVDQRTALRGRVASAAACGNDDEQRGEEEAHGSDRQGEMHDRAPLTAASAPVNLIAP
jgi:hypothetical protein